MSGTGPSSPIVKDEPEDWFNTGNMVLNSHQSMSVPSHPSRFGGVAPGSIDPSELSTQSGSFGMSNFGGPGHSVSGSFPMGNAGMGNSGIGDDELLDLDLNEAHKQPAPLNTNQNGHRPEDLHGLFADHGMPRGQQGMNPMFTNTPNGDPIQSPFLHGNFNYQAYQQQLHHMSPHVRPLTGNGQMIDPNFRGARTSLSHMMDRKASDSRSPMTPKTPGGGANGFDMSGTPDSHSGSAGLSLPHRHAAGLAGPWDSNPASLHSLHSPLVSPATHPGHAPFAEVLGPGKHGSPSALDAAAAAAPAHPGAAAYQSQEAKRRRRRESHNMVERRRRDNINERIQELSHLVPAHRLEDEKLRKHLAANGPAAAGTGGHPLSPPPLAGLSSSAGGPPGATSLLAQATGGRRAASVGSGSGAGGSVGAGGGAGAITLGLPPDDKDKGPNKGDILNGSVGWTRDLMWALHRCLAREDAVRAAAHALGAAWPPAPDLAPDDDERRLRSELRDALALNHGPQAFGYSRGDGSGLRVPGHTNLAGEAVAGGEGDEAERREDAQADFWSGNGGGAFKEESEYEMQLQ